MSLPPYRRYVSTLFPGVRAIPFLSGDDSRIELFQAAGCKGALKDMPSSLLCLFYGSSQFASSLQLGFCPNAKGPAPESLLKLTKGTATEKHLRALFYLGLSFKGQEKKMKSIEKILPYDISSGRCCSTQSGLNRHEQDQCYLLYGKN